MRASDGGAYLSSLPGRGVVRVPHSEHGVVEYILNTMRASGTFASPGPHAGVDFGNLSFPVERPQAARGSGGGGPAAARDFQADLLVFSTGTVTRLSPEIVSSRALCQPLSRATSPHTHGRGGHFLLRVFSENTVSNT